MHRNLHRRVEVMVPLYDSDLKKQINDYKNIILSDKRTLWELKENGDYQLRKGPQTDGAQEVIMKLVAEVYRSIDL